MVIRMLKELSWDHNSIQKIQSEMKDILIEIKNNLQGINCKVDEAKTQISDLEYKKAKYTQSEPHEEKRIQKPDATVRSLWDNFKHPTFTSCGCQKEKRESKKLKT